MPKKSIAIVIKCLLGNGAEKVVQHQSSLFHRYGHKVHIFCFTDTQEIPIDENVPIHIFPLNRMKWLPSSIRKKRVASQLDNFIEKIMGTPDLVLSHLNSADRILSQSSLNVAMMIHMHVSHFYLMNLPAGLRIAKIDKIRSIYQHRKCIAVSQGVAKDFQSLIPGCDIHTIYNPINHEYVDSLSRELPRPITPPDSYLVHIGSLTAVKRHDLLLEAYALSTQDLPLLLVGKGPLEAAIRAQIKALNLEERVIMVGFTDNPYPYMKSALGLILSSDSEALPTVILEALSLGTPVISTDCPAGPRELLPKMNLAPVNNPAALAKKINQLADSPEKFISDLGSQFDEEHIISQYLNLS